MKNAPIRSLRAMLATGLVLIAATSPALATEADIGPVYLDSVGVLAVAGGGHQAGNMEIKIRGGFTLPTGMTCNTLYITTLKTTDSDRRMFALLTAAHLSNKTVRLHITDDPSLTAFAGRCSLMWVGVDA